MAYSLRGNSYVSHLTGRTYEFTRKTKTKVFGDMLVDDNDVRDAANKRYLEGGGNPKRKLSDREIAAGNFMPDVRTATERVCDTLAARPETRHDPYAVGADTVRAGMRLTDSPAKRQADEETIARLTAKSEAFQQQLAARPPDADPTSPDATASALRKAAEELKPASSLPADQALFQTMKQRLLDQAKVQEAKGKAEAEHAAKVKANEAWVVDADATLFLISKDPSIPQITVNEVRAMREKLVKCEATGDEWISFANSVDAQRKQIRDDKLKAANEQIKALEAQKTAIRAGTDQTPPADPPAQA